MVLARHALKFEEEEKKSEGTDGEMVAIKILKKDKILSFKGGVDALVNEMSIHWALEHCQGVLKLLKLFEEEENIMLVLEY